MSFGRASGEFWLSFGRVSDESWLSFERSLDSFGRVLHQSQTSFARVSHDFCASLGQVSDKELIREPFGTRFDAFLTDQTFFSRDLTSRGAANQLAASAVVVVNMATQDLISAVAALQLAAGHLLPIPANQ